MSTTGPMPDSEVNAWLEPLKAVGEDEDGIDLALDALLANPKGRRSLVAHLADFAAIALDPSLPDDMRGRIARRHFGRDRNGTTPNVVSDNSIEHGGSIGWNR
jgi:hypothetical protein